MDKDGREDFCAHPQCPLKSSGSDQLCILHQDRENKEREELQQAFRAYEEKGIKDIVGGIFRGVDFSHMEFHHKRFIQCDFQNASFYGARFKKVGFDFSILDEANFEESILELVDLRRIQSAKNIMLYHAILDGVHLPSYRVLGMHNVYDSSAPRDPNKALDVYLKLKECYRAQGAFAATGILLEMEMHRRRELATGSSRIWLLILWLLCGYGERPARTFASFLVTIFVFALIYSQLTLIGPDGPIHHDLPNSIYFSVVTFTSLGYGDIRPVGWAKFFAGTEALLGIFLISLFVFVFCRRMFR